MCLRVTTYHPQCGHTSIDAKPCRDVSSLLRIMFCEHYDVQQYTCNITICGGDFCKQDEPAPDVHDGRPLQSLYQEGRELSQINDYFNSLLKDSKERYVYASAMEQPRELEVGASLQRYIEAIQHEERATIMQINAKNHRDNMAAHVHRSRPQITFRKDNPAAMALNPNSSWSRPPVPSFHASGFAVPSAHIPSAQPLMYKPISSAYQNTALSHTSSDPALLRKSMIDHMEEALAKSSVKPLPTLPKKRKLSQASANDVPILTEFTAPLIRSGGGSARRGRKSRVIPTVKEESSSIRRSGRLSSKGKKNYAELSDDEFETSPSRIAHQTGDESDAKATSKDTRRRRRANLEYDDDDSIDDHDDEYDPAEAFTMDQSDMLMDEEHNTEPDIKDENQGNAGATSAEAAPPIKKRKRSRNVQSYARPLGIQRQQTSFAMTGAALENIRRQQSLNQMRSVEVETEFNRLHNTASLNSGSWIPGQMPQLRVAPYLTMGSMPVILPLPQTRAPMARMAPTAPIWKPQPAQEVYNDAHLGRQSMLSGPAYMSEHAGGSMGFGPATAGLQPRGMYGGYWNAPVASSGVAERMMGGADGDVGTAYQTLPNVDFDEMEDGGMGLGIQ